MSFKQVAVVVEGACERDFLQSVVAPSLGSKGVYLSASLIGKVGHKGGNVKFERFVTDVRNYLSQRSDLVVSMMVDFFRLDPNWPGMPKLQQHINSGASLTLKEKAEALGQATVQALQQKIPAIVDIEQRFIPYIQMHEYEALLFSQKEVLIEHLNIDEQRINKVLQQYETPEHINTNPNKAPAAQLQALSPRKYHKRRDGIVIAQKIGLYTIRQQCPIFDGWINSLEQV